MYLSIPIGWSTAGRKGWNKDGLRPFSEKFQLYLGWKSSVLNEVSSRLDGNFPFWQKNRDVVHLNQTDPL
jgi:hypothetical protein